MKVLKQYVLNEMDLVQTCYFSPYFCFMGVIPVESNWKWNRGTRKHWRVLDCNKHEGYSVHINVWGITVISDGKNVCSFTPNSILFSIFPIILVQTGSLQSLL